MLESIPGTLRGTMMETAWGGDFCQQMVMNGSSGAFFSCGFPANKKWWNECQYLANLPK